MAAGGGEERRVLKLPIVGGGADLLCFLNRPPGAPRRREYLERFLYGSRYLTRNSNTRQSTNLCEYYTGVILFIIIFI